MYKTCQVNLYSTVCSLHDKRGGGLWGGNEEVRVPKCEAENISTYNSHVCPLLLFTHVMEAMCALANRPSLCAQL